MNRSITFTDYFLSNRYHAALDLVFNDFTCYHIFDFPGRKLYEKFTNEGGIVSYKLITSKRDIRVTYLHLDDRMDYPEIIKPGEKISTHKGNYGNSTGPHVHIEVYVDGKRKDPIIPVMLYAKGRFSLLFRQPYNNEYDKILKRKFKRIFRKELIYGKLYA